MSGPELWPCDLCGAPAVIHCDERSVSVCQACLTMPGRLGGLEHPMPGRQTICAHRRADSIAARISGQGTALYQVGPDE